MSSVAVAVTAGSVVSGYLGAKGAEDAANIGAGAEARRLGFERDVYERTLGDYAPYREAGTGTRAGYDAVERDRMASAEDFLRRQNQVNPGLLRRLSSEGITTPEQLLDFARSGGMDTGWGAEADQFATGVIDYDRQTEAYGDPSQLTGGALDTLSRYGRSAIDEGQYIPGTDIPTYQRSVIGDMPGIDQRVSEFGDGGDIPEFNVTGDIPEFDQSQFDLYKDPGYEFRRGEMERGVNRAMADMGKVTSGNRIEEIMERTGEMASQEYGSAYERMLSDYGLRRGAETEQYGRDVFGYQEGRQREADIYGRAVGEYGLTRGAEDARYGRGVDEYGRVYGRDVDQYGRDLTAYGADVGREAGEFGRGVDAYGRAYGREEDYLGRQRYLTDVGQAAVAGTTTAGGNYASGAGGAVSRAGEYGAAGALGRGNAYSNVLGDVTSMYALNQMNRPPPVQSTYNNYSRYGAVQPPGY